MIGASHLAGLGASAPAGNPASGSPRSGSRAPILPSVPRQRVGWVARGGLVVLALTMALYAFHAGVGVSDREGLPDADLLTHVYYALGLFVLGGLDLGLPSGGPVGARAVLWVAYFMAPLITTSAVVEGVVRLLQPQWLQRWALRNHVVVVGAGRLGTLFVETLRRRDPKARVLLVDRDGTKASVQQARAQLGARFLLGDVHAPATLDAMAVGQARTIALLTNDDLLNLETAWRIAERAPRARVVAHVGDLGMRRTLAHVDDATAARVDVFNAHRIAAERLYGEHLERHFAKTSARDVVVLAGFGRFGQTILEHLQREARGEVQRAIVVDVHAERRVRLFKAQVPGFEQCELVTIQGDIDDPRTWERVEAATHGLGVEPVLVLGTDDDQLNLRAAIGLRALHPSSRIFLRCVYESTFTRQLARRLAFEVLAVEGMLREALADHQRTWLRGRDVD